MERVRTDPVDPLPCRRAMLHPLSPASEGRLQQIIAPPGPPRTPGRQRDAGLGSHFPLTALCLASPLPFPRPDPARSPLPATAAARTLPPTFWPVKICAARGRSPPGVT